MDILLVEDSATLRASMAAVLQEMGHRVHHAVSGEMCLHLIESCQHNLLYNLVLMDVELPGLDGFETTRLLREMLSSQWIPIIFVTGVTDEASYAKGIEAGGDDYLAKPVSGVILKAKIRAMERIADMQREMARLNLELRSTSERDTLTQLLNRRAFTHNAERCWQQDRRSGNSCAVIMVDVDHFKQYNDTYGHIEGDKCLWRVAAAIQGVMAGDTQLVARYGGEEFIALLSNTSDAQARAAAETIRQAVYDLAIEHATCAEKRITVSVGVSLSHNLGNHSLDRLITAADKQLYRAKNTGRNRTAFVELDSHKTILISVSNLDDQIFLCQDLASRGNIVTAENGAECIAIAQYIIPDIVVIGTNVRGDSGACICGELKQLEATANIPVVLLREGSTVARCSHKGSADCAVAFCDWVGITPFIEQVLS